MQSCVHRRNRKDPEEATNRTQSGSEEAGPKEWHCCTRLEVRSPSGLGICQSERSCAKPLPQKDCRSSPHPPDSKHNKPRLWTNFRQYLVPPPHMTPPSLNYSFSIDYALVTLCPYVILILCCHSFSTFPPIAALYKSRPPPPPPFKFCTTDEDLQIETSWIVLMIPCCDRSNICLLIKTVLVGLLAQIEWLTSLTRGSHKR